MNLIETQNLRKVFKQGEVEIEVLKGIDLTIKKGDFISLQGTSGSGKSTLLSILGLLDSPTSGSYFFKGEEVTKLSEERISQIRNQQLGFVFQHFFLIPYLTALENVLIPTLYNKNSKQSQKKARDLLALLNLQDRLHFKPAQLSGGQQQRVAIARALINEPEIILADEPTGQLDSRTGEEILNIFQKINDQGKTIILVTHDPKVAGFARQSIILEDGQIVSQKLTK